MNAPPAKKGEIRANAWVVNLVAIPVTMVVTGVIVVVAVVLPHKIPVGNLELVWLLVGMVVLFTLHEIIHAIALKVFDDPSWKDFKFGFNWRLFVFYCHCRRPVTIRAFQKCALGPLAVLGPITLLATLVYPAIWLALLTGVHLSGCIGDVWVYARSRQFPAHFLFLDFPDKIGGEVFEPASGLAPISGLTTTV
jgi:hypothetical protein